MARVLIVEPEPDLRSLAEQAVLELGHEPLVLGARTPGVDVDVVLLAISADALALAGTLRRAHPALPIVCLGILPAGDAERALRPVAHLVKPYTLRDLGRALRKATAS